MGSATAASGAVRSGCPDGGLAGDFDTLHWARSTPICAPDPYSRAPFHGMHEGERQKARKTLLHASPRLMAAEMASKIARQTGDRQPMHAMTLRVHESGLITQK